MRRGVVVDEGCGRGEERSFCEPRQRGGSVVDYKRSFCCVVSRCLTRVRREEGRGREGGVSFRDGTVAN